MVMHVSLPILNGHMLQGTDAPESMGFQLVSGNNVYISLSPDSQEEADQLFNALAEGGKIEMPLQQTFWGAYFGSLTDQFGIRWMVNYNTQY
jgi:PhnB protein